MSRRCIAVDERNAVLRSLLGPHLLLGRGLGARDRRNLCNGPRRGRKGLGAWLLLRRGFPSLCRTFPAVCVCVCVCVRERERERSEQGGGGLVRCIDDLVLELRVLVLKMYKRYTAVYSLAPSILLLLSLRSSSFLSSPSLQPAQPLTYFWENWYGHSHKTVITEQR